MFPGRDPRRPKPPRKFRRGLVLLPSSITVGNLFCGYACIVHAMRGQLETAAAFIGVAIVLDMLDGRIARLTGTTSAFGLEFDSLADMVSFGLAPAVLAFAWGLSGLGKAGWAAGFVYVTATAMRLARFNIQTSAQVDKRYFVGMPSPAAAGVPAATILLFPNPLQTYPLALAAIAVVIVPGLLMVSTIRFRSFKTIDLGWQRRYAGVLLFALLIAFITVEPAIMLVILAYGYLCSAFIGLALSRARSRRAPPPRASES
jgi:CDP-diacylglycerol--serine O-phosphatidyltransferase